MIATFEIQGNTLTADLSRPLDISIPIGGQGTSVAAWYVPPVKIEPVRMGEWVGSVKSGASVNFNDITFNPHGHGTHTESLGHITAEAESVNQLLKSYFFLAQVISVEPSPRGDDRVILRSQVAETLEGIVADALVIRTLPNDPDKLHRNYSNTNPPYLEESAARFIRQKGFQHLLIDLPSVDREEDEGRLLAHKAFWDIPSSPRKQATITELVYVPDRVTDGAYLLNLQVAPFEHDASPSRPVLFEIL